MKNTLILAACCCALAITAGPANPAYAFADGDSFTCTVKSKKGKPACKKPDGTAINITGTGTATTKPAAKTAATNDFVRQCNAAGGGANRDNLAKPKCHSAQGEDDDAGDSFEL